MKIKTKAKFLPVLIAGLLLVGCNAQKTLPNTYGVKGELPKLFLENNKQELPEETFSGFTKMVKVEEYDTYEGNVLNSFIKVVKKVDGVNKYGVYSLEGRKQLLPPQYDAITFSTETYYNTKTEKNVNVYYAHVDYKDDQIGLFSLSENKFIVPTERLDNLTFNVVINNKTKENIENIVKTKPNAIEKSSSFVTFDDELNLVRNNRPLIGKGSQIEEVERERFPDLPKLNDFEYEITESKMVGYKEGKRVFTVELPVTNLGSAFNVDKYRIVQSIVGLALDAKEYTFSDGLMKYLVSTSKVDMTNGKITKINNLDYIFDTVVAVRDKDKNKTLLRATAIKIVNKAPLGEQEILFNANLQPLANLSAKGYKNGYVKVAENRYLTVDKLIVDENYETVLNLERYSNIKFLQVEGLISLSFEGLFGLIDVTGKVIVPFDYEQAFSFLNGRSYNVNAFNDKAYFFKVDGTSNEILDDKDVLYQEGLIRNSSITQDVYKNFGGESLVTVSETQSMIKGPETFFSAKTGVKQGIVFVVRETTPTIKNYIYILH